MKVAEFSPPGRIDSFDTGTKPNLEQFLAENLASAFRRMGIDEKHGKAKEVFAAAIRILSERSDAEFTGRCDPSPEGKMVLSFLADTFVGSGSTMYGRENFDEMNELAREGHNVLIIQNHTTAVDALVNEALRMRADRESGKDSSEVAYISSQVFEYSRLLALLTSGVLKFPVFQPKHFGRIAGQPNGEAVGKSMIRQNHATLCNLKGYLQKGGRQVFLYPERDRNPDHMGQPEPAVMRVPEFVAKSCPKGKQLFVVPSYVDGATKILPVVPGPYEMDNLFDNLNVADANVHYGKPVPWTQVQEVVQGSDAVNEAVAKCLNYSGPSHDRLGSSFVLLSMIADLAPAEVLKWKYGKTRMEALFANTGVCA